MGAFVFHDKYPETYNSLADVDERDREQADFGIDSDASDGDLLELKQELEKLDPERLNETWQILQLLLKK